jgi:hypothetical protein
MAPAPLDARMAERWVHPAICGDMCELLEPWYRDGQEERMESDNDHTPSTWVGVATNERGEESALRAADCALDVLWPRARCG